MFKFKFITVNLLIFSVYIILGNAAIVKPKSGSWATDDYISESFEDSTNEYISESFEDSTNEYISESFEDSTTDVDYTWSIESDTSTSRPHPSATYDYQFSSIFSNNSEPVNETIDHFHSVPATDSPETSNHQFSTDDSFSTTWIFENSTENNVFNNNSDNLNYTLIPTFTLPDTTVSVPVLASNEFQFNSSVVIVWEKCGLEARTQVTQIFKSVYNSHIQVIFSYDPSINVIIYELINKVNSSSSQRQILKLPNLAGELLFFVFNEPGKVNIFLDCPSVSKHKFVMDFFKGLSYLSVIGQNAKNFASLHEAMQVFKCRSSISILPGTIIHFDGQFTLVGTALLISFQFDKESFSITIQNGLFVVTTSTHQLVSLTLTQTITSSGIYLVFTQLGVQIHVTCPTSLNIVSAAAFWNTTIFESKLHVETSRHHYYGNVATTVLLNSFCSTNSLISLIDGQSDNCISKDKVLSNIQVVDNANQVYLNYIPTSSIFDQIQIFNAENTLSFGNLIENEPKILIASREYAEPEFFNKNLNEYIEGFSDGQSNFWIGLGVLNRVTNSNDYKLRVVAINQQGIEFVEEYIYFRVGNAQEKFKLTVGHLVLGSNGFFAKNNGAEFSTYDSGPDSLLARQYASGYWHTNRNSYCFSCVFRNYKVGSAATVSLSQGINMEIFKTKMYLVPIEKRTIQTVAPITDSVILYDTVSELMKLIEFNNETDRYFLLYRGSRDGFGAKDFHSHCDFTSNTLTIVKSGSNIFGGFTSVTWDGAGLYKQDNSAFVFSLRNYLNKPMVMKIKHQNAIYAVPSYGPTFGGGFDFMISDQSNTNANSGSNLGYSYQFDLYPYGSAAAKSFLAGSSNFRVDEVEVFVRL